MKEVVTIQREVIISAGIDIGTSTTKMVFSELEVVNTAGYGVVPQIKITNKRISHRSAIYRTPLLSVDVINMSAIFSLILKEYEYAGLSPKQIQTGAIIITGETATKSNAMQVIHTLSAEAGDFLVATAGEDLEGILAAKGSGAYEYSASNDCTIANVDIGGGTANIAVYKNKQLLGTCTLHVGGRLIEFAERRVTFISPSVQKWAQQNDRQLDEGVVQDDVVIEELVKVMTEAIFLALKNDIGQQHPFLLGHLPNWTDPIDTVMFSGGVSNYIYDEEASAVDDIGWLLAKSIKKHCELQQYHLVQPLETVSATVIGTSTQTTEISGATIQLCEELLPLKNIPIVNIDIENLIDLEITIQQTVLRAKEVHRMNEPSQLVAWYFSRLPRLSFKDVTTIVGCLLKELEGILHELSPYIFIFAQDYGRVFGQTVLRMKPTCAVISIDQIDVQNGDYIDIGRPLQAGVVPVVIKTLAFHGK